MTFKKPKYILAALVLLLFVPAIILSDNITPRVSAAPSCAANQVVDGDKCKDCGKDEVSRGNKCVFEDPALGCSAKNNCVNLVDKYVNPLIKLFSVLVGLVVTASIIVGAIQYSSATGDPSKVATARKRIFNAVYALIAYILLLAFLQWLIPGGII